MPGWTAAAGDFNGGGTSDLLWINPNGVLDVWTMQNGAVSNTAALNHDMSGWSVIG